MTLPDPMTPPDRATPATDLTTEAGDTRFDAIDEMSTAELATVMNDADAAVPLAVKTVLPSIVVAVDGIVERLAGGGRLIYVGAGSSGRIGVLDASECPPTFGTRPDQVVAIIAGGHDAIVTPSEGTEDDEEGGVAAMVDAGVGAADAVVGIASSGRTPYVVAALRAAADRGALTIGLSCNANAPLSAVVDHPIEVLVGPEVVAGSTRLKAGTAQKLVLNMVSTITMVRLGKTYGNLMVDLRPTNAKLRERAVGIVGRITGASPDDARAALDQTGFSVQQAVLVLQHGLSPDQARTRLRAAGGRLKNALDQPGLPT